MLMQLISMVFSATRWLVKIFKKKKVTKKVAKKKVKAKAKIEANKKSDFSIKEIIAYYSGNQIDYDLTTYYPKGLIEEEEGVPAILELTDEGGWSVSFCENNDIFNLKNAFKILTKKTFNSIVSEDIELDDTSGVSGRLHLNGEIVMSDNNISIKI